MSLLYVALGTMFGFVLSRSGAADYDYIQAMFLFEDVQLYGIIATAVVVTAPGVWLIKRRGRTLSGGKLEIELKPLHRGNLAGGALFGIGWSLAGMCPGPILVNIGEGKIYALAALAGALTGAAAFGSLYDVLQRADPSPVVELNRAVAVAMREGPEAGLALVDAILARGELTDYYLAHSARADLCRRLGRTADAAAAYERALSLTRQEPERRFLERRLRDLTP